MVAPPTNLSVPVNSDLPSMFVFMPTPKSFFFCMLDVRRVYRTAWHNREGGGGGVILKTQPPLRHVTLLHVTHYSTTTTTPFHAAIVCHPPQPIIHHHRTHRHATTTPPALRHQFHATHAHFGIHPPRCNRGAYTSGVSITKHIPSHPVVIFLPAFYHHHHYPTL
jgi:hypothetical protein